MWPCWRQQLLFGRLYEVEMMGFGLFLIISLVSVGLSIASFSFWIWMLVECVTKEPSEGNDKLIWILVIVFTNAIGAAIYYFVRRPERIQIYGR